MEISGKLLEILSSTTRVRLINLLMERPRCLAELSSSLEISPQAVLKHLKLLQKEKIVSSYISDGSLGLVKNLYGLASHIYLYLDEWKAITYFCAYKKDHGKAELTEVEQRIPKKNAYDTLQKIDYEKYILKRKLKSIKEKEMRILQQLFDLESLQKQIMMEAGYTNFEEILFYVSISEDYEKEIRNIVKYFGLDIEQVKMKFKNLVQKI